MRAYLLVIVVLWVATCGQKGPLELPAQHPRVNPYSDVVDNALDSPVYYPLYRPLYNPRAFQSARCEAPTHV